LNENSRLQSIKRWFGNDDETTILSADAFARLYEESHLVIFRYVYGLTGGPLQEVEDLTAETYERAWRTRQRFQGDEQAALSWLLRIARNLAIDLFRRRKVHHEYEDLQIDLLVDSKILPEMNVVVREQMEILWRLLGRLPEDVREMIVLRYMLGWKIRQVGVYLHMSENSVSVTIGRALKGLRRDWLRLQEEEHG
jgi:RNA polymerase sigma-70 factor, ECF subfamily